MTKKIGDIVGHPPDIRSVVGSSKVVSNTLVGVEIELESLQNFYEPIYNDITRYNKYWSVIRDGSLRGVGSAEFVLTSPLAGEDLVKALINFELTVNRKKWNPQLSDRTSVHIHVDIRDMTKEELKNFIILYTIFERVLFKYAGPDRDDNIFCLGIENSQGIIESIHNQFNENIELFPGLLLNFQKYAACNLRAITAHGSLEFRQHAGEFKASKLLRWVNILLSLGEYAKTPQLNLENLPSEVSLMGMEQFTKSVFGKYSRYLMYPELERDVLENIRLSQDIIFYDKIQNEEKPHDLEEDVITPFKKYFLKNKGHHPRPRKIRGLPLAETEWMKVIFGEDIV